MRAVVVFLALFTAWPAGAQNWRDSDLGTHISEGFATRDDIWLLGGEKVVRFARLTGEREVVAENVRDMLPDDGRLWILVEGSDGASYTLRDLRGRSADDARRTRLYLHPGEASEGEPIGLFAWPDQDRPAVLTRRAVVTPTANGWTRHRLAASLGPGGRVAGADDRSVYLGYNHGEWGGGLRRIDIGSGTISFVTQGGDELCGGVLNPACAPIVGIYDDASQEDCVIVGSGLSHLGMSHGQIVRVCGSEISEVYSTPVPAEKDIWMMMPQPWPLHGLFETPGGWLGVSRDRYFRSIGGHVEEHPMPEFAEWAGLRISEEQNGVLFVISSCCWGSAANPTLYNAIALPILP